MSDEQQGLERVAPDEGMSASSSDNPGAITNTIKKALATGHYLGPATTSPVLPPGCAVAFSAIKIDADRETYDIPGRSGRGITKTGLNRISKGVGVSWDARLSHRVDKGEDSFLAVYKAVGHYRDFDGSWITIEAEKQMDLRDGSEAARSMKPGELAIQRKFIAEHAQTKAQLRAIRSGLGIEIAYTKEFFRDPFICARLVFTARSDNPATQAIFDNHVAHMMLGGVEALYGSKPQLHPMTAPDVPEMTEGEQPAEEEAKVEADPVYCNADVCYFEESDGHIKACKGKVKDQTAEKKTESVSPKEDPALPEAWAVPVDFPKAAGKNIGDVSDSDLSSMFDGCVLILEQRDFATKHSQYNEFRGHFVREIDRRRAAKAAAQG